MNFLKLPLDRKKRRGRPPFKIETILKNTRSHLDDNKCNPITNDDINSSIANLSLNDNPLLLEDLVKDDSLLTNYLNTLYNDISLGMFVFNDYNIDEFYVININENKEWVVDCNDELYITSDVSEVIDILFELSYTNNRFIVEFINYNE